LGEISVFTASVKDYADPIIDEIDPRGVINKRFYREVSDLIEV
jgi:TFIIF-interacting CTD phosphatase-like protein